MEKTPKEANPRFHPWATPPMGSAGDPWDLVDYLPEDGLAVAERTEAARSAERAKLKADWAAMRHARRYVPPIGMPVVFAWGLTVAGLTTVGSGGPDWLPVLRLVLLMAGCVVGAGAVLWLRGRTGLNRGIGLALGAALLAAGVLVWEGWRALG